MLKARRQGVLWEMFSTPPTFSRMICWGQAPSADI